jgi:hypothetical protein
LSQSELIDEIKKYGGTVLYSFQAQDINTLTHVITTINNLETIPKELNAFIVNEKWMWDSVRLGEPQLEASYILELPSLEPPQKKAKLQVVRQPLPPPITKASAIPPPPPAPHGKRSKTKNSQAYPPMPHDIVSALEAIPSITPLVVPLVSIPPSIPSEPKEIVQVNNKVVEPTHAVELQPEDIPSISMEDVVYIEEDVPMQEQVQEIIFIEEEIAEDPVEPPSTPPHQPPSDEDLMYQDREAETWSKENVQDWLSRHLVIPDRFASQRVMKWVLNEKVDGEVLLELDDMDVLKYTGFVLGVKVKIAKLVTNLKVQA